MLDTRFNIIIMSSLPESYRPTLQTITAAERASKLSGGVSQQMKPNDLIAFIIEEAQHCVISDERSKNAESALAAHAKKGGKGKPGKRKKHDKSSKDDSEEVCDNCKRPRHGKPDCWSKGGGKEGQGPRRNKSKRAEESAVVAATNDEEDLFAFTCTSDYATVAEKLQVPKSKLGTCIDSGASRDYCPDHSKFSNYRPIDQSITTVMSTEVIRRRSSLIFASARSQDRRRAPGQRPANRYWLAESSKNSHKLADVRQGTRPTTSYPSGIQVGLRSRNRDLGYTHRAPFVFAEESLIEI